VKVLSKALCIIPVHNRSRITTVFAERFYQDFGSCGVLLVVDDGSTDDTQDSLRRLDRRGGELIVLEGNGSLYWAGAVRLAMQHVLDHSIAADVLLICNDDIEFEPGSLQRLAARAHAEPQCVWSAVNQDASDHSLITSAYAIDLPNCQINALVAPIERLREVRIDAMATRAVAMAWEIFRKGGLVRSELFPHAICDLDYTNRLSLLGYRLRFCEDSIVLTDRRYPAVGGWYKRYFGVKSKDNLIHKLRFFLFRGTAMDRVQAPLRLVRATVLRKLLRVQAAGKAGA
jgi:GT2 family glycosyltransferase